MRRRGGHARDAEDERLNPYDKIALECVDIGCHIDSSSSHEDSLDLVKEILGIVD